MKCISIAEVQPDFAKFLAKIQLLSEIPGKIFKFLPKYHPKIISFYPKYNPKYSLTLQKRPAQLRKQTFTVIIRPIRPMSIQNRRRAECQCRARTSTTEARTDGAADAHFGYWPLAIGFFNVTQKSQKFAEIYVSGRNNRDQLYLIKPFIRASS